MASATLEIIGDAASVTRMFGQIVAASRRATAAIASDWRRLNALQESGSRTRARAAGDEATRAAGAARRSASEHERAERRKTRAAEAEAAKRQRQSEREAEAARKAADRAVSAHERAERRRTQATEREARRRTEADTRERRRSERETMRNIGRGVVGAGRTAAGAIGGMVRMGGAALSEMMGGVQDAQTRRALTQRQLGMALYQTGAGASEVRARGRQLTDYAAAHGMDSGELANALNAAQTEFSSLAGDTPAERERRFNAALETARLGRNTGNDPGEFLRLQGMLAQSGFDPATQRQALLFSAGAAQRGAVETGDLTRSAMASVMARMSQASGALGPGATAEQRSAAALGAFREHFAEIQVARGFGNSTRRAGEATRNLSAALVNSAVQDNLLNNIRHRGAASADPAERARIQALEEQLFERDTARTGDHRRLRANTGPLQLAAALASAGFDATSAGNMFSGGGPGNARSLQANWRNMLGVMLSQDTQGVSGAQRIQRLMGPGTALTEADVARGTETFEGDALSQQTRRNESRDNILSDNTTELSRLNATLQDFRAHAPMQAISARTLGGELGEVGAAEVWQRGQSSGRTLRSVLEGFATQRGGERTSAAGPLMRALDTVTLGSISRGNSGQELQRMTRGLTDAQLDTPVAANVGRAAMTPADIQALINAVRTGASQATITVNPIAAAQARGEAAPGAPRPAP